MSTVKKTGGGVLIAIKDYIKSQLFANPDVNIKEVLLEIRKSRMGLIQTPDQLRFSYAAIIQGAKQLPSNNVVIQIYYYFFLLLAFFIPEPEL